MQIQILTGMTDVKCFRAPKAIHHVEPHQMVTGMKEGNISGFLLLL